MNGPHTGAVSHGYCPVCYDAAIAEVDSAVEHRTRGLHKNARLGRSGVALAGVLLCLAAAHAFGQAENEVTAVGPGSAAPGTAGLTITFTLDSDDPPSPPAGLLPDSVTIGSLMGTSVAHPSQHIVAAVFDIPLAEAAGGKDVAVVFTTPLGSLSFTKGDGFTVTAGSDTPPSIAENPASDIVQPGQTATFSVSAWGTEPLYVQWEKDETNLVGRTDTVLTIPSASNSDEGRYRCVVSNACGMTTSAVATLTVTDVFPYPGYNLYNPVNSTNTTLMDNHGTVVRTWSSTYRPGQSVYLLDDGSLLRTANTQNSTFDAGGAGGRVEKLDWDGSLTWAFEFDSASHRLHHDVEPLPNGNILMIAWELKTQSEAGDAGRDPDLLDDGELWPDMIIEVAPTGSYGGEIVWEWHVWDHLVQDYSAAKPNYGVVGNHPGKVDLNYVMGGPAGGGADWTHINAIAYNAELDQVILSVRNFSEIWIIDHSTTTAEAAGHTGGNSGKGGNLLYRWGNPQTYDVGDAADQQLFVQHDAKWIEDDLPGAGHILVFNNGQGRRGGDASSVDELVLPVDAGGSYTGSVPYGPSAPVWSYMTEPETNFYAARISGAQRLPNGSTLICEGTEGRAFEVSTNDETVWQVEDGAEIFRFERYDYDFGGFDNRGLDPSEAPSLAYTVVDTGQAVCYDDSVAIANPTPGQSFAGQDAQYAGNPPAYIRSIDGLTVYDANTGLTWTQSPDLNGDGLIDVDDKLDQPAAAAYPAALNASTFGGFDDWRLPTIKELYSLMDFSGVDISGESTTTRIPFIETNFFAFGYGDTSAGERDIDAQFATTTLYVDEVMNGQKDMFGLNLADGRIKGYPTNKLFYVLYCRGNTDYGENAFVDNGDGTVTDRATGLMWQQADSGSGMNWSNALSYAEGLELGGYRDWRLPNAKELQTLVDYTRSPGTTGSAAIDPVFQCTAIANEEGQTDYPWVWSSTTHVNSSPAPGSYAAYVCFGRAWGYMNGSWQDVHGAGCQRSDPKGGSLSDWTYTPYGTYSENAPQGDAIRIFNFARCVRGGGTEPATDSDGDGLSDWYEWNYAGSTTGMVATVDGDGDGAPNIAEEAAGTIPTEASSVFAMVDMASTTSCVVFCWSSELGRTYALQCSSNLVADPFSKTLAAGIEATPPCNVYTAAASSTAETFYRLVVE